MRLLAPALLSLALLLPVHAADPVVVDLPGPPSLIQGDSQALAWPAGAATLAEAVARLQSPAPAAGEAPWITLGDGVAADAAAALPAFSGTWAQGLAALCAAFDLALLDGAPVLRDGSQPTPLRCGPLLLVRRQDAPAQLLCAAGPLLVVFHALQAARPESGGSWLVAVDATIRLEPRIARSRLGAAQIEAFNLGLGGRILKAGPERDGSPVDLALSDRIRLEGLDAGSAPLPRSLDVHAAAGIAEARRFTGSISLTVGARCRARPAGDDALAIAVALHAADAIPADLPGGSGEEPLLLCDFPAELERPSVRVEQDGRPLRTRALTRTRRDGRTIIHMRVPGLAPGAPATVQLSCTQAGGTTRLVGSGMVPLDDRPAVPAPAAGGAGTVAWPAGPATLADACARLADAGAAPLIDLGIDAKRSAQLPAVAGSWWDGIAAVAAAFDLSMLPADATGEAGGVRLGARKPGFSSAPAGPLLITAQLDAVREVVGLGGAARIADVRIATHALPWAPPDHDDGVTPTWTSADIDGGAPLRLGGATGGPNGDDRAFGCFSSSGADGEPLLRLAGLPPGPCAITLRGVVSGDGWTTRTTATELAIGAAQVMRFANGSIELRLLDASQAAAAGLPAAGLVGAGAFDQGMPTVTITPMPAGGAPGGALNHDGWSRRRARGLEHHVIEFVPEPGVAYRIELSEHLAGAPWSAAVTMRIAIP